MTNYNMIMNELNKIDELISEINNLNKMIDKEIDMINYEIDNMDMINNNNPYKIGDKVSVDLAALYVTVEKVDGCAILTYGNIGHTAIVPEHIEEGSVWEDVDDVRCFDKQVCKIVEIEEDDMGNVGYLLRNLDSNNNVYLALSANEMKIGCSPVV